MKRKRDETSPPPPAHKVNLEEIVGFTTKNGNGLASSISKSKFAFIAGGVAVLCDVRSGTQSHLMAPKRDLKPLSCVALSTDAGIIAAGEIGRQSGVLVWDCTTLHCICELKGHQYGVASVALSHDGKHLVSAGLPRDGYICIWDWKNKILATKFRASSVDSPISCVEFSMDDKFLVTAGKNHLQFWKFRVSAGSRTRTRSVSVIKLREFGIGKLKNELGFVAVSFPIDHGKDAHQILFYAVTEKGTLCMVYPNSSAINMVELEVEKCHALSASTSWVACACNNGLVKLFGASSLKCAGSLCYAGERTFRKTEYAHCKSDIDVEFQSGLPLPDALACRFSSQEQLVVVYGDCSLHMWNISDMPKATRRCLLTSHSGCIWNIMNVPCEYKHDPSFSCAANGCFGGASFATCSADGFIRLWDLVLHSSSGNISTIANDDISTRHTCLVSDGIFRHGSVSKGIASTGFRSMSVSSDGKHLAAGDFDGNINIFDFNNSDCVCIQDAHDGEVLSLSFSWESRNVVTLSEAQGGQNLLASAGRDGKIHLFYVDRNFCRLGSIDCNTSAVTAVKIVQNGHQILSFGDDRSLVLHSIDIIDTDCKISSLGRIETSGIISDMAVDHRMDIAFILCQDKKINIIDVLSRRLINCFQHDGDTVEPIKIALDGSCSYLACSTSNKCICVYECMTGNMIAQATGHTDAITGIIFLPDCVHLVSVSADGCIFVWKLPSLLSSRMLQRIENVQIQFPPKSISQPSSAVIQTRADHSPRENSNKVQAEINVGIHENARFEFSLSRLPKWAQDKVIGNAPHKATPRHNDQCVEVRSPCNDATEVGQQCSETLTGNLSEASSDSASPTAPANYRWAANNNQWQTIHTVCMDLMDSPSTSSANVLNRFEASNKRKCKVMEAGNGIHPIKLSCSDPSTCTKTKYRNMHLQGEPLKNFEYEKVEAVRSIEEELKTMEVAADNVLKLFEQLGSSSTEGSSNKVHHLYAAEATTTRIVSIERKIHQIGRLLQQSHKG